MAQYVTYDFPITAVPTSAETFLGTITNVSGDLHIVSVNVTMFDTATSNPPITVRVRQCSTSGTGTAATGIKVNPKVTEAIKSTGKKTITVAPTVTGTQDGAAIAYNAPYLKTAFNIGVAVGESAGISIERNSGTGTPNGIAIVTVLEGP